MYPESNSITHVFHTLFGSAEVVVRSPGRINLIGEHTDYNNGFVLPSAIDREIHFAVSRSDQPRTTIHASDIGEVVQIYPGITKNDDLPFWGKYFFGVLDILTKQGTSPGNVNCVFGGNIPQGAGLSSSAALTCGFAFALNKLFNLGLDRRDIILIGQQTEHDYAGLQCGIMDQFASVYSKEGYVIQLDCNSLDYSYIPIDLKDYQLLLVNSHVAHELAESEYNQRRADCEFAVKYFQDPSVKSLRDIHPNQLNRAELPAIILNRCRFVLQENLRVLQFSEALKTGNLVGAGELLYASHDGLRNLYQVTCDETDFLVDQARNYGIAGARQMGGGFGGCTLNLLKRSRVNDFSDAIQISYRERFDITPEIYPVNLASGTSRIS